MPVNRFRILLALLVVGAIAAPAVAQAGAVVTHVSSRDDGGYINIGRQTGLAASNFVTAGVTYAFWWKQTDAGTPTFIPCSMGFNFFAYTGMGGSTYSLFQLNSYWTTDYFYRNNAVNIFPSGNNAVTWAKWVDSGVNFNDGNYHHFAVVFAGLSGGQPTRLDLYIDGVLRVSGQANWTDYSDGTPTTRGDYAADIYIGPTQKSSSNTLQDFNSFNVEDYRTYAANLTTSEILEIFLLRGRDTVRRGMVSRYPFLNNWSNLGSYGVAAIPANDNGTTPTLATVKHLSGQRRRVMRIDMQRLLEPARNEDRELAEPHQRQAA
jgi:hypothetical protein